MSAAVVVVPCKELRDILLPAFAPCFAFNNRCASMRWRPREGHIPRGFCGATGKLNEVKLVLILAEPGDPYSNQANDPRARPEELLESACQHTYACLESRRDRFHRNVRFILDCCWPTLPFGEQLRRTWITESVLCSAEIESGPIPGNVELTCGDSYLRKELDLFLNAVIGALGKKARTRVERLRLGRSILCGESAAHRCSNEQAHESWGKICEAVRKERGIA